MRIYDLSFFERFFKRNLVIICRATSFEILLINSLIALYIIALRISKNLLVEQLAALSHDGWASHMYVSSVVPLSKLLSMLVVLLLEGRVNVVAIEKPRIAIKATLRTQMEKCFMSLTSFSH